MDPDTLISELDQNRRMMRGCPQCKAAPWLKYEPGCTHGGCDCKQFAAPDWDPKAVREEWNQWAGKFKPIRK